MPTDYAKRYQALVSQMTGPDGAATAVGGHFEEFGVLMRDILAEAGLREKDYLIDVGCGSGRLAHMLTVERYLGTDVVPELLEHARSICPNPNWRFELVDDRIAIPEQDGVADMVCFFSVFTHLLHEDSFRYLREARRVLRPGGKVLFSFLEFRAGNHWAVFEDMIRNSETGQPSPHNQFLDREAIQAWASHAGFSIERFSMEAGQAMRHPYDNGIFERLGQSVCVLVAL
jgi:SAM-dependent methyltransferase